MSDEKCDGCGKVQIQKKLCSPIKSNQRLKPLDFVHRRQTSCALLVRAPTIVVWNARKRGSIVDHNHVHGDDSHVDVDSDDSHVDNGEFA